MKSSAIAFYAMAAVILTACASGESPGSSAPEALESERFEGCFNGAGFFETDLADLTARLPHGYAPLEGSFLGPQHAEKGMLALIYFSCPVSGGDLRQWAMIATPVEDPPLTANLRPVRWSWYEMARLERDPSRAEGLRNHGLSVQPATFHHDAFSDGDAESSFAVSVEQGPVFQVRAVLARPVDFDAQSHRFWHLGENGSLISTRLDFDFHPSWLGSFQDCTFESRHLGTRSLDDVECTAVGVTEAIERLDFAKQIVIWN